MRLLKSLASTSPAFLPAAAPLDVFFTGGDLDLLGESCRPRLTGAFLTALSRALGEVERDRESCLTRLLAAAPLPARGGLGESCRARVRDDGSSLTALR